ncbi:MAG TPA: prolyl oligopeptidase family serine peptidase [Acidimicrobiales bacterium]|nr:prolyl oligopeptidase family serine peptidase [Acidimicrobiales bacterium]
MSIESLRNRGQSNPPDPEIRNLRSLDGGDTDGSSWKELIPPSGIRSQTVALMDMGLRTGLASLLAATAGPATLLRTSGRAQRKAVQFFADLADSNDPASVFTMPPEVEVRARRLGRQPWAPRVGHVDLLTFLSPYEPACPDLAESYKAHRRNSIARAQHWRHEDGPRPTILVVHGFTGSPYWFNSTFFSLPWFYSHGCDVVLVTLPFHGGRNDRLAPFSGSGLFRDGLGHFHEGMLQSVCDIRVVIDYLRAGGVEHIGITGLSLGGYLTALMAALEPRLHVSIPNSAVTDLAGLIDGWFPAGHVLKAGLRQGGIAEEAFRASMSVHSPLHYPPVLAKDRLFVIGGLGDRLAPPEQSARLIQHWGRPKTHWFQGSHILHVGRAHYLREIGRFLKATGFSPG